MSKPCHEWVKDHWRVYCTNAGGKLTFNLSHGFCPDDRCGAKLDANGTETPMMSRVTPAEAQAFPIFRVLQRAMEAGEDGFGFEDLSEDDKGVAWGLGEAGLLTVEECGNTVGTDDEPPEPLFGVYPNEQTGLLLAALSQPGEVAAREEDLRAVPAVISRAVQAENYSHGMRCPYPCPAYRVDCEKTPESCESAWTNHFNLAPEPGHEEVPS